MKRHIKMLHKYGRRAFVYGDVEAMEKKAKQFDRIVGEWKGKVDSLVPLPFDISRSPLSPKTLFLGIARLGALVAAALWPVVFEVLGEG